MSATPKVNTKRNSLNDNSDIDSSTLDVHVPIEGVSANPFFQEIEAHHNQTRDALANAFDALEKHVAKLRADTEQAHVEFLQSLWSDVENKMLNGNTDSAAKLRAQQEMHRQRLLSLAANIQGLLQ